MLHGPTRFASSAVCEASSHSRCRVQRFCERLSGDVARSGRRSPVRAGVRRTQRRLALDAYRGE